MLRFFQEGKLMDVLTSDLEWETFSESSSSEDHEDVDYLFGGQARNIFSSLQESIGKIDEFLSFERLFVHGEVVRYTADPSGQMGRVTGIDMFVDLENLHGNLLKNVNTKKLSKFCSISENDYVILGPWLGRVNKVVDKVTIVFDDGTKCEVNAPEKEKVEPIKSDLLEDSQYPYYPGQRVCIKSSTSKPTGWLCGNWKENQVEGTILSVEAGSVYVNWLASALSGSDQLPMPPCLQDSKKITLLSCFSHANWQLGDWCVVPRISDCKLLMGQFVLDSAIADTDKEQGNIGIGLKKGNFGSCDEVYCIVKTKTKVDVLWQDGTHSIGLDSQTLQPVTVTNAHEFWPMQFVLESGTFDDPHKSTSHRWGVVKSMDAQERTVRLRWQSIPMTETEGFTGDRLEETVSAYELIEHPDYSFCYGDIVFKAAQKQLDYLASQNNSKSITGLNSGAAFKDRLCINCGNDLPCKCYLCCIGNVTGFGDGTVDVKWANGFTTKVAPHEIFKIDKNEDASSSSILNEANADVLTQEMVEHDNSYQMKKGKGLSSFDGEELSFQKHSQGQGSHSFVLPRAAMELFSSIKTSIFRSLGVTSMSKSFSVLHDAVDGREPEQLNEKVLLEASDVPADSEESELQSFKTSSDEEGTAFQEQKYISSPRNGDLLDHFKQFGIISDCTDHQFCNASKGSTLGQPKRGWMKKVQQEWSILEKNLPETIYVRVYEERMDLLRAAIIGAPGTPYHDGIFFFDICFPPEYPYQPPMVHYYSGGLRVNPNLYESGKVCLSLLNTWTGSGTEVWNPSSSTVLQVLLSLQALVLNVKPYFNEAGYDKQIGRVEGEKNSVSYNENAFLLTCKTMLYILKKPPKHFEALVQEHFNERAQYITLACKSYLEGTSTGRASGSESEKEMEKGASTGFKIMLGKLFPKLVEAFSEKGIDCSCGP